MLLTNTKIQEFQRLLAQTQTCAVIAHTNPDGDTLGAALGLCRYFGERYPQMKVRAISPNRFPACLAWLEGAQDIMIYSERREETAAFLQTCTLVICADFDDLSRIEELGKIVAALNARKVLIDHHPTPAPYFDLTFSDTSMSAASELVYRIIRAMDGAPVSRPLAELLYTGIFTDTGGFAYGIKNSEVFRIAADLIDAGIDRDAIASRICDSYSVHRMRLMGYVLKDKMQVFEQHRAAYIALTRSELNDYHFEMGDTEGFANIPLSIKNIEMAAFFYEDKDAANIRVSLRSKGRRMAVNEIARQHFGGGGHFNAAGGKFAGSLQECCKLFEGIMQKICIFAVFLCLVQCAPADIKPYKAPVSLEKQRLQEAHAYWSRREYDQINAYIRRQGLAMTQTEQGYCLQIVNNGGGRAASQGSRVTITAQIYLLDGTLCHSYGEGNPLVVTIGREALISGFHAALDGLRQGTEALALFSSHLGWGLFGDRRRVPPRSPLLCKINIVSVD